MKKKYKTQILKLKHEHSEHMTKLKADFEKKINKANKKYRDLNIHYNFKIKKFQIKCNKSIKRMKDYSRAKHKNTIENNMALIKNIKIDFKKKRQELMENLDLT